MSAPSSSSATPLRLDLARHSIPGLADVEAEGPTIDGAAEPVIETRTAAPIDVHLSRLLYRRRAPMVLTQGGRAVRCVVLPPQAAPESRGPYLNLTFAGRPAAIRIGWNIARRIAGVPLEPASPEDAALLLEDALTPWLDQAEDLLGVEIRFHSLDRSRPDGTPIALALGVEAGGSGAGEAGEAGAEGAFRHVLPLMLHPKSAEQLGRSLTPWLRPREAPAGLWLRAGVEIETARLTLADIESLGVGDALLIDDQMDGTARVVIEDRLVAAAKPVGQEAGRDGWQLLEAFGPRSPQARPGMGARDDLTGAREPGAQDSRAQQTEDRMADSDDPQPRPVPAGEAAPAVDLTGFQGDLRRTAGPAADEAEVSGQTDAGAADDTPPPERPAPPREAAASAAGQAAGQAAPQPEAPRAPPSALGDLELRLSIRLGETLISVADLREAGPGTMLMLDRPDGALVDIVANGQTIGTGEIINVSGQRAVEIRTLFGDG